MESPISHTTEADTHNSHSITQPTSAQTPRQQPAQQNQRPASPGIVPSTATSPKPSGVRIGPYILGKTLGQGSTGRVKLATHIETNQKVAVKIIPKQLLRPKEKKGEPSSQPEDDTSEFIVNKKLEREIAIMKLIQHPRVMALYDVYESPDELYMVLELVEGGELFDYLVKKGRLKEAEALDFFQQIISGIDYCHKHLICHRDLKPENLLLDAKGRIKIADFGMASLQVTGKLLETSCGSPHYASPEVIRGIKYNGAAADVWSCGVILYALLTGNLPFDDENIRKLLQKVKSGVYVIPETVPNDAADLIRKMLTVSPTSRITISEIESHPWFNKLPYRWKTGGEGPLRSPPSADATTPFKGDPSKLDEDILNSLSILGYGSEREIYQALCDPEPNYEKVFYWALKQRKNEFLEKYDNEYDDASRNLHRRTGSRGSVFSERTNSSYISQELAANPNNGKDAAGVAISTRRTTEVGNRKSFAPSPLSAKGASELPEVSAISENETPSELPKQPTVPTSSTPPQQPAYQITQKDQQQNRRVSLFEQFKKHLSLSDNGTNSTNSGDQSQNNSRQSPKGNHSLAVDTSLLKVAVTHSSQTAVADSNSSLASPGISSAPKKSWFANLFQFKPEVFVAYTSFSPQESRVFIEKNLQLIGVQYQYSRDGISLKCKYDGGGSLPVVKFRISLNSSQDEQRTEIVCTQQQGALSSFQVFFEKLKACIEQPDGQHE